MALLDIIIDTLRINCSVVQCTGYTSEIEALFYLFFFPTVFIILLVYILTNFIFRGEGNTPRGLRLLVSVTLYAFIVMEGLYTMFASLSRFWWLFAVILIGLWAFIRHLIGGGSGGGGKGNLPGLGGGALGKFAKGKLASVFTHEEEDRRKEIRDAFKTLEHFYNETKGNPLGSDARRGASDGFERTQTRLRQLITDYGSYGKVGKVPVIKQDKKFWEEYGEWSDKFMKLKK